MSKDHLALRFRQDLQRIAEMLLKHYQVRHTRYVQHLDEPLLRWMDFRARYIEPRPRQVLLSGLFPKSLPPAAGDALLRLTRLFEVGDNVNAHQGKGLTLFHDTSGSKKSLRTDLLWADWGIHHLHLSEPSAASNQRYSARSDWLLFCLVAPDVVAFIDVRRHGTHDEFADPSLITQVLADWPEYMEQFRLSGILPSREGVDKAEISRARATGVMKMTELNGAVYVGPGLGITTAATSGRLTRACDDVYGWIRALADEVQREDGQFVLQSRQRRVHTPSFSLALTRRGLCVYESHSDAAFVLPRRSTGPPSYLCLLHQTLIPMWVQHDLTLAGK